MQTKCKLNANNNNKNECRIHILNEWEKKETKKNEVNGLELMILE